MELLKGRVPTATIKPGKRVVPPGLGRAEQLTAALDNGARLLEPRAAWVSALGKTDAGVLEPDWGAPAGRSDKAAWKPIANPVSECTATARRSSAHSANALPECSAAEGCFGGGTGQTVCEGTTSTSGRDINA